MIYGLGTDIVEIMRISDAYNKNPDRFVAKLLSEVEINQLSTIQNQAAKMSFLAGRWAAKEAVAKALGTGIRGDLNLSGIVIDNNDLGCPFVSFSNSADEYINKMLTKKAINHKLHFHLSISHEQQFATATVVIELRS